MELFLFGIILYNENMKKKACVDVLYLHHEYGTLYQCPY